MSDWLAGWQDVADSKRVNTGIHRIRSSPAEAEENVVSATIVSGLFWPTFQKDELKLPPAVGHRLPRPLNLLVRPIDELESRMW